MQFKCRDAISAYLITKQRIIGIRQTQYFHTRMVGIDWWRLMDSDVPVIGILQLNIEPRDYSRYASLIHNNFKLHPRLDALLSPFFSAFLTACHPQNIVSRVCVIYTIPLSIRSTDTYAVDINHNSPIIISFLTRIKKGREMGAIRWHCRQTLQRMRAEFPTCWNLEIRFLRVRPNESTTLGFQSDRRRRERVFKGAREFLSSGGTRRLNFRFSRIATAATNSSLSAETAPSRIFPLALRDPNHLSDLRPSTILPPLRHRRWRAFSVRRGAFKSTA